MDLRINTSDVKGQPCLYADFQHVVRSGHTHSDGPDWWPCPGDGDATLEDELGWMADEITRLGKLLVELLVEVEARLNLLLPKEE